MKSPHALNLPLTHRQASVLARLIRLNLDAYAEALSPDDTPHRESEPLNGNDLDLLEPLVALLEKDKAPIC